MADGNTPTETNDSDVANVFRSHQVPLNQGGLGESMGGRIDSTAAKDPLENDGEENEENGSLKVEILQKGPLRAATSKIG